MSESKSCLDPLYWAIQQCMSFRDKNLIGFERAFMLLNVAQVIAILAFCIIGAGVFQDKFLQDMSSF